MKRLRKNPDVAVIDLLQNTPKNEVEIGRAPKTKLAEPQIVRHLSVMLAETGIDQIQNVRHIATAIVNIQNVMSVVMGTANIQSVKFVVMGITAGVRSIETWIENIQSVICIAIPGSIICALQRKISSALDCTKTLADTMSRLNVCRMS